MKKAFLSILLLLVATVPAWASYHFSATCSTGQTLYYRITDSAVNAVMVTCPRIATEPYSGFTEPSGDLEVPSTVTYNGTTYSVVGISSYAFRSCAGLTSVTIPNSVTSIGYEAFYYCTGLTGTFTIPGSVISIGQRAFYKCSGLTSVTIPNSVITINGGAFRDCTGLTSITIPNSVDTIQGSAFLGCTGLTTVNFNATNCTSMASTVFSGCTTFTTLNIGNNVQSIPAHAFYECSGLTAVSIPNSITTIGNYAFYKCSGLISVTIPNSVTNIGEFAFSKCTGLTSVTIGDSVTTIGRRAFGDCTGLTAVNFNATNCTSVGYDGDAFSVCPSLTTLTIGENVQRVPSYAFYGWTGPTTVNFNAANCTSMESVFADPTTLTTLNIGNNVQLIPTNAFNGCTGLTGSLVIPNSVTTIGYSAFKDCSGLTGALTIPNSVTFIGLSAFQGCSGLTSLTMGNSVTSIGFDAFKNCSGLAGTLTIPSPVTSIGNRAFYGCGFTTLNFNATNCTSVGYDGEGEYAFSVCPSLTTLNIGNNVQRIPAHAFQRCSGLIGTLAIPNSVTIIGESAFSGCSGLTGTLTIPNSVTNIGGYAFFGCSGLTTVNFNATNCATMGTASKPVFSGCTSLATVNIGENVQRIPQYAFYGCSSLTGMLTIPNSVTIIGNSAFYGCSSLASVTIGNAIDTIYSSAFSNDTNLTAVYYTGDMAGWCDINFGNHVANPLYNAHNLYVNNNLVSNLIIPDGITKIKDFTFARATCLISVSIPNSVSSIGRYPFYECANIPSVTIPSSVTFIGLHAFGNCRGLTSVYYTGDIAGWCSITFTGFASNPLCYAHNLYIDNSLVTNLVVPEGVTEIKKHAFFRAYSITSVSLPSTLTSIGDSVFFYDSTITELYTKNPVPPTVGYISFYKIPTTIPVYIPCGRIAYYTAANRWSNFSNFIEENPASFSAVSADPTKGAVQILTMPTCTNPQAAVYASPNNGYQFDHWSNGSTANPLTLTVTEDMELIAYFSPVGSQPTTNYTMTVVSNDPTMGYVTGGGSYAAGSTATLTATANSGYHFVQWHDGNTQASRSITVTGDSTYTAYFAANAENEYTITVIPQNPAMGSTTGSGTFPYGTQTTITAEPNPGYLFVQWQDGNPQRIRTITVTCEATYTAYFDRNYGIDDISADDIKIYVNGRNIIIEGSLDESVMVYDVMGRTIFHDVVRAPITAPAAGVYMVKIGNAKARKVVILK